MFLLFLIGLGLVIYLFSKHSNTNNSSDATPLLEARNKEWAQFIANYRTIAKTKAEKALVNKMLADLEAKGLPVPFMPAEDYQELSSSQSVATSAESGPTETLNLKNQDDSAKWLDNKAEEHKNKVQIQLDNASLLLYFGAFLFVASTGLFVVFGGVSGGIRCFIVLLVMAILYGGGIWLHQNKPKLEQAGLAFAGIGMAIAPLVGLAAYNYLFSESHGSAVWFSTSVLCLGMYAHALFTLRKPLINYIFIFTFLSLFESSVSIIHAPIYYFGWMLALVGILLSLVNRIKGFWPDMQESSRASSTLFIPMSVLVSLVLVSTQGSMQLGISLLLAAAYYGLETLSSTETVQQYNAVAAQVALNSAVASLAYSVNHSWLTVGLSLLVLNVVQTGYVIMQSGHGELMQNFGTILLVSQIVAAVTCAQHPSYVLGSSVALAFMAIVVWLRQSRNDAYTLAAFTSLVLPLIFGELVSVPHISNSLLVVLLASALVVQFLAVIAVPSKYWQDDLSVASHTYLYSLIGVLAATFLAPMWLAVLICLALSLSGALLIERGKETEWAVIAGLGVALPLLRGWEAPGAFLTAAVLAMLLNIFLALRHRNEVNRWLSTILWLVLPLAFGSGILGSAWGYAAYTWAYLVAMLGLVLSRAIARGVVLLSSKVPMASYAKTASTSYVAGYWAAATISVILSLLANHSQLHTTIILSILAVIVWVLSEVIEKQPDLLTLLPLLAQGILWSAIRPSMAGGTLEIYLFVSLLLAVVSYFSLNGISAPEGKSKYVQNGSLIAVFIAPLSILAVENTVWPMPVGLMVAGGLLYYHVQDSNQNNRELAGGLIAVGLMWLMNFLGIREVQAYVHVLIALFAGYAYWRHIRSETKQSDQYIQVALLTATVPLAIQALSGSAGGLYGWWLLLEQVMIMIIGMSIGKRYVTMWGLYVAVAAVLYQLRDLGWAAVAVLALFLIGMAVFKIQKYNEK